MTLPTQGSLLPYATPTTALAACRRIEAMVLTVAPEMTYRHCNQMQGELCVVTMLIEQWTPLAAKMPPRSIVAAPETVLLYCRDVGRQIVTSAATLSQAQCLRLLQDLLEATAAMEQISLEIRQGSDWQTRQQLPALPTPTLDEERDRLEEARQWRAVHKPIVYQRTQAAPLLDFVPGRRA